MTSAYTRPVTAIADLLTQSAAAHRAAAIARQQRDPEARNHLTRAAALRVEAIRADPDQTDPAWRLERVPHAVLMAFYARHLR